MLVGVDGAKLDSASPDSKKALEPNITARDVLDEYASMEEKGGVETSTRLHFWLEFVQGNSDHMRKLNVWNDLEKLV